MSEISKELRAFLDIEAEKDSFGIKSDIKV